VVTRIGGIEMHESTEEDRELIESLNGLYVGILTEEEREALYRCRIDGFAKYDYEHSGGLFGLAKVVYLKTPPAEE